MIYTKPQILDSCRAHECINGVWKLSERDDGGHAGVIGTPNAYEADE
jgi:hypothetical protein